MGDSDTRGGEVASELRRCSPEDVLADGELNLPIGRLVVEADASARGLVGATIRVCDGERARMGLGDGGELPIGRCPELDGVR
jgi:hypothetical protein